ncbi:MAG: 30S ribosomal protein S9 [Gemmatimonadota bacterium]|nr:MAG: 30S ribosomal protein S9 [Gemmatimonadota bacterium]
MAIDVSFDATGRRREAAARVRLTPGDGKIYVNNRPMMEYFGRESLAMIIQQPLESTNLLGKYDVIASAKGGGLSGQAGAIQLGIARALLQIDPDFKKQLKAAQFLTRDPRMKERKKYGLAKRRKRYQFSKR